MQLLLPPDWFPLNRPGVPEYLHVLYNVTAPLLLLRVTSATQVWQNLGRWAGSFYICAVTPNSALPDPPTSPLLQMLGRNPRTPAPPPTALHLGLIAVVMGSSLHLVADSVTRRLLLLDYRLHLSVRENPLMKQFKDSPLVGAAAATPLIVLLSC